MTYTSILSRIRYRTLLVLLGSLLLIKVNQSTHSCWEDQMHAYVIISLTFNKQHSRGIIAFHGAMVRDG